MTDSNTWPRDYFDSRNKFVQLGAELGAHMESHPVAALGPAGEALSVDVASLTSEHDEHRIILTSGVHGVEGFIGAFVQLQALKMLFDGLPDKTGVVMIHAANPWGFAHLRRVDENNIDINRNFFSLPSTPPSSHEKYAALDAVINPKKVPSVTGELRYWLGAFGHLARSLSVAKLFKPIAEGQYDFPKGVFYGGQQTSESCQRLQSILLHYSADVSRISVLDIHSGLGSSTTASIIGNTNLVPASERLDWLRSHFGTPAYLDSSDSNLYDAKGTFSRWCDTTLNNKQYVFVCIEIGTVNPIKLFSALRRENQAHHWSETDSETYKKTKQALLAVFAPASSAWRIDSTAAALQVFQKALKLSS